MLKVQLSPRRKVYVTFCDDTFPNKGGYYCQIYGDENLQWELDNFVIHNNELAGAQDRLKKAYIIANFRVKTMF